ncbi:DNA damage-responsive transcriptional repressor RPH1 [Smittium culicis]|uniref:DNA damage-responsive transcriptional repressor RPH1 n=1 Tax=Smittium culicis TaxID=133412 RepID=A0A1R1Y1L6_9FUNG|nr:DNA damage-responsive transcriptional repressor RPH1 [Smittium culicis]
MDHLNSDSATQLHIHHPPAYNSENIISSSTRQIDAFVPISLDNKNVSDKRKYKPKKVNKINYNSYDIETPTLCGRPIKFHFFPESEIPVFTPDYDQFIDFNNFIKAIEPFGINSGLVKVVPPKQWRLELEAKISSINSQSTTTNQRHQTKSSTRSSKNSHNYSHKNSSSSPIHTPRNTLNLNDTFISPKDFINSNQVHSPIPENPIRTSSNTFKNNDDSNNSPSITPVNNNGSLAALFKNDNFPAFRPIVQHFDGSRGVYRQFNVEYFFKNLNLSKFLLLSEQPGKKRPNIGAERLPISTKPKNIKKNSSNPQPIKNSNDPLTVPENCLSNIDSNTNLSESSFQEGIVVDYKNGKISLSEKSSKTLLSTPPNDKSKNKLLKPEISFQSVFDLPDESAPISEQRLSYYRDVERTYWKNLLIEAPMYGADVPGSIFPPLSDFPHWNIRNLNSILSRVKVGISGVTQPYLYLGMWKSTFSWHLEDMDLYSINYIHFGASKAWFSIPRKDFNRFQLVAQGAFASDYKKCKEFLRHKAFHLSPNYLASQGIKVNRVVHNAGEFMITFPYGYHSGYNLGFNLAESTNFALDRWIEIGKKADFCKCIPDSVKINMDEWFGDNPKNTPSVPYVSPPSKPTINIVYKQKKRDSSGFSPLQPDPISTIDLIVSKRTKFSLSNHIPFLDIPPNACSICFNYITNCLPQYKNLLLSSNDSSDTLYKCASCFFKQDKPLCSFCGTSGGLLFPLSTRNLTRNRRSSRRISEFSKRPHFAHLHCSKAVNECYLNYSVYPKSISTPISDSTNKPNYNISTELYKPSIYANERKIEYDTNILSDIPLRQLLPKNGDSFTRNDLKLIGNSKISSITIKIPKYENTNNLSYNFNSIDSSYASCDSSSTISANSIVPKNPINGAASPNFGCSTPLIDTTKPDDGYLGGLGYSIDGIEDSLSVKYAGNCSYCKPLDIDYISSSEGNTHAENYNSSNVHSDAIIDESENASEINDGVYLICATDGCKQKIHPTCAAMYYLQNRSVISCQNIVEKTPNLQTKLSETSNFSSLRSPQNLLVQTISSEFTSNNTLYCPNDSSITRNIIGSNQSQTASYPSFQPIAPRPTNVNLNSIIPTVYITNNIANPAPLYLNNSSNDNSAPKDNNQFANLASPKSNLELYCINHTL